MPRAISPTEKLVKKIKREFPRKKMIGDIPINDQEFKLLISNFKYKYNYMRTSGNREIIDPVFCVALVQIGIRYYDGAFWPHVKSILQNPKFNTSHQMWIGSVFVETLKKYGKIQLGDGRRVESILMHGFVSDRYSDNFFNFLYAFYKIDLERDISRVNREVISDLATIVQKNDNRGRTYFLVEQTADAFRLNSRGAKLRVRRYLKLIDKAFWGEELPDKSTNRLMSYFLHWKDNSPEFLYEKRQRGDGTGRGKKSFASPYLKYFPKNDEFKLVIPPQIIRLEDFEDLRWIIEMDGTDRVININPYQCVTGYKTEEVAFNISEKNLFATFCFSLMNGCEKVRSFKIVGESIRLFDKDGDFVRTDSVQPGFLYSFTKKSFKPKSEALVETDMVKGLLRTTFELVNGDIIRLPDGKPISVGGKVQEGLLPRGVVEGVVAENQNDYMAVYANAPVVIIKTSSKRVVGTAIYVNENIYHFSKNQKLSKGISEFPLNNRTGEMGYAIDLQAFGVKKDGIYEVRVDVPNDHSQRWWKFTLIKDLDYEFEDAPYIFNDRGTLSLPTSLKCIPEDKDVSVERQDRSRYNFDIEPGKDYLYFKVNKMRLGFEIPAFAYQFDGEEWYTGIHVDVWHSEFNPKLKIKYTGDRIRIFLNDAGSDDADEHSEVFFKNKKKNIFECDLNRFKSWFGRDQVKRKMFIEVSGKKEPIWFMDIITKSVLVNGILKADFEKHLMIGDFDIVGRSKYYADIYHKGKCICDKILLNNGHMELSSELRSGQHEVKIYEAEEDDTGFGDDVYYEIGRRTVNLLNAEDLDGQSISISMIRPMGDMSYFLPIRGVKYCIVNLQKSDAKDVHNYRGKMLVLNKMDKCLATFLVNVEFFDLKQLGQAHITFIDDDYEEAFLYDDSKKIIVKQEDPRLSKSQAYRRYKNILYQDEYVFSVNFFNPSQTLMQVEVDDTMYNNKFKINKNTTNQSIFKRN